MPNGVKYSTTTPTGALRKDNVALGVNGNLGPTETTGFYSMVTPASGKYTINKVSVSGVPNFFTPQNDAELIRFAVSEGATGDDIVSAAAAEPPTEDDPPAPPPAGVVPERKTTFDTEPVLGINVTKLFCPEVPVEPTGPDAV